MTIQNISSTSYYQANYSANQQLANQTVPLTGGNKDVVVVSEQESMNAMLAEQKANIASNYQTATNIDLTRLYYQQQQKVIDAYMNANSDDNVINNGDGNSATGLLNDTYASLYEVHQAVKNEAANLPGNEYAVIMPEETPENEKQGQTPVDKYNSIMMPSNASHIHLSA